MPILILQGVVTPRPVVTLVLACSDPKAGVVSCERPARVG